MRMVNANVSAALITQFSCKLLMIFRFNYSFAIANLNKRLVVHLGYRLHPLYFKEVEQLHCGSAVVPNGPFV